MNWTLLEGDAIEQMQTLPEGSVHCCVTSPPYWGLRDYGIDARAWGGNSECHHEWGATISVNATNHTDKRRWQHTRNGRDEEQPTEKRVAWLRTPVPQGQFCQKCSAWARGLGLEPTPEMFVDHICDVFAEVWRVLRPDGTLWLNMGDCYATGGGAVGRCPGGGDQGERFLREGMIGTQPNRMPLPGLKSKDLVGMPWRVAFALQAAGWYLRQEIIWHKVNPMPESVTDRCTKAHESIFLLAKSERYYFDQNAIKEPVADSQIGRVRADKVGGKSHDERQQHSEGALYVRTGPPRSHHGSLFHEGKTADHQLGRASMKQRKPAGWDTGEGAHGTIHRDGRAQEIEYTDTADSRLNRAESSLRVHGNLPGRSDGGAACNDPDQEYRNKRSVWTIPTCGYPGAHFATFPPDLIKPCILAGCPEGGTVLEPFAGSGTTLLVANSLSRNAIGIELNPAYCAMARERLAQCHLDWTEPEVPAA